MPATIKIITTNSRTGEVVVEKEIEISRETAAQLVSEIPAILAQLPGRFRVLHLIDMTTKAKIVDITPLPPPRRPAGDCSLFRRIFGSSDTEAHNDND